MALESRLNSNRAAMASRLSWFWRDARKLPVLMLWAAFAIGLLIYFRGDILSRHAAPATAATARAVDDDALYTGSIILVPRSDDDCRKLKFDNRTGLVSDDGYIDCYSIAKRDKIGQGAMGYARMLAIHSTFSR